VTEQALRLLAHEEDLERRGIPPPDDAADRLDELTVLALRTPQRLLEPPSFGDVAYERDRIGGAVDLQDLRGDLREDLPAVRATQPDLAVADRALGARFLL